MRLKDLPKEFNLYPYLYQDEKCDDEELQKEIEDVKRTRAAMMSDRFAKGEI